jgi:hypothetical protein
MEKEELERFSENVEEAEALNVRLGIGIGLFQASLK